MQGITSGAQARLPGDPNAGESLFFAAESCARCHAVNGRGGFMASDLSTFARGRSVAFVENAIVHPPERANGKITLSRSRPMTDRRLRVWFVRDNFTMVLQTEDGVFHSVPRDTIRSETMSPNTYMPDYRNLSKEQIDNLASYLLHCAASPAVARVIPASGGSR